MVVCAWCGKDMGKKEGKGMEGTSHGICEEYIAKVEAELIARLGVKVIPTEDLKTRRICCRLNINNTKKGR